MNDDFAIGCGLENRAMLYELAAQMPRIGEIAIMGNGKAARCQIREQGLHIAYGTAARRGIAHMANGRVALQGSDQLFTGEIIGHKAQLSLGDKLLAVECGDTGGFLPAMLQGVQP